PTRPPPSADTLSADADKVSASVAATDDKSSVGIDPIDRIDSPSPAGAGSVAATDDKSSVDKKKILTKLNKSPPIWTQDPTTLTPTDYTDFYKTLTSDHTPPLAYKHIRIESIPTDYELLLYIPSINQTNIFQSEPPINKNIKLYCNNIFITDNFQDIIPTWMTFITGIISAPHLPINISREMLQGSNTLKQIKKLLFKQTLSLIEEISLNNEKFNNFYKQYSNNIKLAIKQDTSGNKQEFINLLRYKTNKSSEPITFKKYKEEMVPNQKQIYVLTSLSENEAKNSPFLDMFNNLDLQVFLMDSGIDEVMLQGMSTYDGVAIQRINVEGVELPASTTEDTNKDINNKENYDKLITKLKTLLNLDNCILKNTSRPFLISASKYGQSAAMKGLMHSQIKESDNDNNPYLMMMNMAKPVLYINPENVIIQRLNKLINSENSEDIIKLENISKVLYSTAEAECSLLFLDANKVKEHCKSVYTMIERDLLL
ncbi:heat shock protein 90, partial [Cucumispora dikerogammari]